MTTLRLTALLTMVSLTQIACSGPWMVAVYNNDVDERIGVRLRLEGEQRDWILAPQQIDTLVQASARHAATLELFDPSDCSVLVSEELPDGPGVLALAHKGVTGDGPWRIDAGIETGISDSVLEPNFDGCK